MSSSGGRSTARQKSSPNGVRWMLRRTTLVKRCVCIASSTSGCASSTWYSIGSVSCSRENHTRPEPVEVVEVGRNPVEVTAAGAGSDHGQPRRDQVAAHLADRPAGAHVDARLRPGLAGAASAPAPRPARGRPGSGRTPGGRRPRATRRATAPAGRRPGRAARRTGRRRETADRTARPRPPTAVASASGSGTPEATARARSVTVPTVTPSSRASSAAIAGSRVAASSRRPVRAEVNTLHCAALSQVAAAIRARPGSAPAAATAVGIRRRSSWPSMSFIRHPLRRSTGAALRRRTP